MYVLCKQGKPVSAAAKAVAEEMKLLPSPVQAIARLQKNFRDFRKEKEKERASRSARPAQSGNTPSVEIAEQARQVGELLRTKGKAIKENARFAHENKRSILDAAELVRRIHKPKI
jgi:hypothetical protein